MSVFRRFADSIVEKFAPKSYDDDDNGYFDQDGQDVPEDHAPQFSGSHFGGSTTNVHGYSTTTTPKLNGSDHYQGYTQESDVDIVHQITKFAPSSYNEDDVAVVREALHAGHTVILLIENMTDTDAVSYIAYLSGAISMRGGYLQRISAEGQFKNMVIVSPTSCPIHDGNSAAKRAEARKMRPLVRSSQNSTL